MKSLVLLSGGLDSTVNLLESLTFGLKTTVLFFDYDQKAKLKESQSAKALAEKYGIFLNVAAGMAESLEMDYVVPGFNLEEAQTFPDNSEAFLQALDQSLHFSTNQKVKTKCFTQHLNKTEIVKRACELGLDFSLIWPCYQSQLKWCGNCESCKRTLRALENNQINYKQWIL
jgi:7-cyano-7-deazaguanine synthase